jgi:uracil-DNA glycosylase family 4
MDASSQIKEVLEDACALMRQSARVSHGTIQLSPEVAEMLENIEVVPPDRAAMSADLPSEPSSGSPDVSLCGSIEELERAVSVCTKCPLSKTRTQTVFGTGNSRAKLVFVGEAPGHDEDVQGKPFVGRAGQLLTDIIEKGMKLKRSEVYICNVLKCRPPNNRNPLPDEVETCEPHLVRQLELIQPRVICALGTYAAQTLLKTRDPIGRLRGKWHFYHGIPLRATFHPAYLLRSPADKRKTWMDVIEIMKVYNGEFTPKPEGGNDLLSP